MSTDPNVARRIQEQVQGRPPRLREAVAAIRALVRDVAPEATETLNSWHIPTFDYHGPMCYFSFATSHVTFGFYRGGSLEDPKRLLEGTGKDMRHIKVRKAEDLQRDGVREIVEAAARLNRENPQRTRERRNDPGLAL